MKTSKMTLPRERQRSISNGRPKERPPIREPGNPLALERCYEKDPEEWSEDTLREAIEMQRREREGRLEAKARKRAREVAKKGVESDGRVEISKGGGADVGGREEPDKLTSNG